MAKKIVRGITDVKTINNQDFDTNNVNDLLSDGQYNYIHRKKGKGEEYHNLTDNIKTLSSDNTDLLTVTNNNKTTNTATLHPKHDSQKEQVLESTRNTVTINHGTNGTAEKTTVDTNPKKVLEHENLKTGDGLTTSFDTDETTIRFKATRKPPQTNLNTLGEGVIRGNGFSIDQVPSGNQDNSAAYVTIRISENGKVQFYSGLEHGIIRLYYRFIINDEVTEWKQMVGDSGELNNQLAQKQNKLTAGDGLAIENNEIKIKPKNVETLPANSGFYNGGFMDGEWGNPYTAISLNIDTNKLIQLAFRESVNTTGLIIAKYRFIVNNVPSAWQEMTLDSAAINSLVAQKQNKLTAMDGISITGDSIYLTSLNDYSEDLNNLTYTCTAKPIDNTPNLPTGASGNGVLSVIRVGNVVSQTYHALDNNVYYRITNNSSSTFVWTPWVKLTTLAV